MGKSILVWLRELSNLLSRFKLNHVGNRYKDVRFSVLQYGCYIKNINSGAMLWQKLGYIHENPVRARLAERPGDYPWSSAAAYATRIQGVVQVDLPI